MRYTHALGILEKVDGFYQARPRDFLWRKGWLAQKDLVMPALFKTSSALRRIPGLPYFLLPRLLAEGLKEKPVSLKIPAEAIQVGEKGNRLRLFDVTGGKTLKVVAEDSHYFSSTLQEIKLRAVITGKGLLIPKVYGHEIKDGLLRVEEEFVSGRSFHHLQDKYIFVSGIVDPLTDFYGRYGITRLPFSEALGPLLPFIQGADISPDIARKLSQKLGENPMVAISLCHNDVVGSNLAVSKGRVYFLDWGFAIMSLCGRDFVRIGRKYLKDDGIRTRLEDRIARLQEKKLGLDDLLAVQEAWKACIRFHQNGRMDMSAFPVKT